MDQGTLVRDDTAPAGRVGAVQSCPTQSIVVRGLVFDAEALKRLFRSTAHAIFLAKVTPDRWLPQEVDTPDEKRVDAALKAGEQEYGDLFMHELYERGANGAVQFLEDLQAQRENALAKKKRQHHNGHLGVKKLTRSNLSSFAQGSHTVLSPSLMAPGQLPCDVERQRGYRVFLGMVRYFLPAAQ